MVKVQLPSMIKEVGAMLVRWWLQYIGTYISLLPALFFVTVLCLGCVALKLMAMAALYITGLVARCCVKFDLPDGCNLSFHL